MSFIDKIKIENIEYDIQDTEARKLIGDNLLRNLGHFEDIESFPDIAQPSGEIGEHPSTFEIDPTKVDIQIPELPIITTMPEGIPLPYFVGVYLDEDNYMYVATDTPEYIESFSYSLDGSYCFRTPLTFYPNEQGGYNQAKVSARYRYNGLDGMVPDFTDGFLYAMDEMLEDPSWDAKMGSFHVVGMTDQGPGTFFGYIGGNGRAKIFGNLPTTLKYKNHLEFSGKKIPMPPLDLSTPEGVEIIPNAFSDSLTLTFKDNYTYTDGMDILRFDEQGNAYWITDEDGAKENDVATVGDNNDIYVNEPDKGWTPWAKPKDIDTSMFLKPKGFVNSEADLPSMGQPSGTQGSYPRTFSTDPTLSEITIPTSSYPYIFGVILNDSNYLYVATRFPEVIKSMAYGSDGSYEIYFEATSDKPVAVYYKRSSNSGAYCIPDSYTGSYGARDNQKTNGTEIYVPSTLTGYLGGSGTAKIFGNLPNKIKYKAHTYYGYARTSSGTSGYTYQQITDATSDSLTLAFKDNYIYNEGMNMLQFDENYKVYWILADPQEEPNSMYLVGPKNEQYISTTNEWVRVSNHDSYTKAEIDAMLGEIENVLDDILNGG